MSPPALVALALNVSRVGPSQAVPNTQSMAEGCPGPYRFCLASSSDLPSLPPGSQLVQPHANTTAGNEPFPPSASSSSPGAIGSTCPDPESAAQSGTAASSWGDGDEQTPAAPRAVPLVSITHPTPSLGTQTVPGLGGSHGRSHLPTLFGFMERGSQGARPPCHPCPHAWLPCLD